MEAEIGSAAGSIWRYLNDHGEATIAKVRQGTKLSEQLVLMGVGWLAKEDKLQFSRDARTMKVSLRENGAS
jgi:hypothetical protein